MLADSVLLLSVPLVGWGGGGGHQTVSTVTGLKGKNQFLEWYFCILDQLWWLIFVFVLECATCTQTILIARWNIFGWQILQAVNYCSICRCCIFFFFSFITFGWNWWLIKPIFKSKGKFSYTLQKFQKKVLPLLQLPKCDIYMWWELIPGFSIWNTQTRTHVHTPICPHAHPHDQNIKFCVQLLCKLCCALLALVSG